MIINWFSNMPHFMGSLCNRNKYKCLKVCICSKLLEATSVVFPNWVKNHCHYNITGDTLLLFNKCEYERKLTFRSFIQETSILLLANTSFRYSILPKQDARHTLVCCSA